MLAQAHTVAPLVGPNGELLTKTHVVMSSDQVRAFRGIAAHCERLRLKFILRCDNCAELYNLRDGCRGGTESGDYKVVIECACARRVGVI